MTGQMETTNFEGICRYCGEIQPVLAVDQMEADVRISEKCNCGGYRREKRHTAMEDNIEAMFGAGCDGTLFKAVTEEQMDLIKAAGEAVFEGHAASISIGLGKTAAKLSITVKGNVKVERSFGTKIQMES